MVRVVIADGDLAFVDRLRGWLHKAGYEPLVCADGNEALGLLVPGLPTIVLADWDMPGLDGLELCRRIRASPLSDQVYAILITANTEEGQVVEGLDAGANDYLIKPRKRGELLARIRAAERLLKVVYEKRQRENELGERVKELDCLYALSRLVQRRDISLEATLQQAAELIPPAWQHPEIACVRIVAGDMTLQTGNYAESKWTLTSDISANGNVVGAVEVGYLEERPELDEGPFLREERDLLNAISEQLGRTIELRWAEQERARVLDRQVELNHLQQELLGPDTLKGKLGWITDFVVNAFDADFCRVWITQPGDRCEAGCVHAKVTEGPHICRYRDRCLHLMASSGRYTHTDGEVHRRVPFGCYKIGRVAADQDGKFLTNEITADPRVHNHDWAEGLGLVAFAGYQLRPPGGDTIGVMALFSRHAISPEEDALIETVAHATAQVIQAACVEQEREELHRRLIDVSREAGMAEVATGVLHNVGNVLNSVNVSASIVGDKLRQSRVSGVAKAAALLREHADHLNSYPQSRGAKMGNV